MGVYYNNGAVRTPKQIWYNSPSVGLKQAKEVYWNVGGVVKRVWPDISYDGTNFYGDMINGIIVNNYSYDYQIYVSNYDGRPYYKHINSLGENATIKSGAIQILRNEGQNPFVGSGYAADINASWSSFRSVDKIPFNNYSKMRIAGSYAGSAWHSEEAPYSRVCSITIELFFDFYENRHQTSSNNLKKSLGWSKTSPSREAGHSSTGELSGTFNNTFDISDWTTTDYLLCNLCALASGDGYRASGSWECKINTIEFLA